MTTRLLTRLPSAFAAGLFIGLLAACSLPTSTTTKTPASAPGSLSSGEILEVLRAVNEAEIEQAELVAQRSQNGAVLAAAERVIEDHRRYNQRVIATARLGRTLEQSPLSQQLALQAQQATAKLSELTDTRLDCAYLSTQIQQHQAAVNILQTRLLPEAKDEQVKLLLTSLTPALEHHLRTAQTTFASLSACAAGPQ